MIAVDTKILVRTAVRDDAEQTALAEALLSSLVESRERCYISDPVLCELEWVLRESYEASRSEVAAVLGTLLAEPTFELDDRDAVTTALDTFQRSKLSWADCLIAARAQAKGVRATCTFDRPLSRLPGLTLLR